MLLKERPILLSLFPRMKLRLVPPDNLVDCRFQQNSGAPIRLHNLTGCGVGHEDGIGSPLQEGVVLPTEAADLLRLISRSIRQLPRDLVCALLFSVRPIPLPVIAHFVEELSTVYQKKKLPEMSL
jgi:hypothetical protein